MKISLGNRKKQVVDMTVGNPARHIVAFSLPLIAGFLFQMLYNTVDTWVVGNHYDIYGDAYGTYNSMPRLIARYTYER